MSDTETKQGSALYESESQKDREAAADKASFVRRWLEALELSSKEEEDWRKCSAEARTVYESGKDAETGKAFNIYYANIETLRPALYNSTPIPDIRRRFGDRDQSAKEGADAIERCLMYAIDDYDFDGTIRDSIDDLSITGRGVARVTYEGILSPTDMLDEQTGQPIQDVGAQLVGCETVPWASFRRGPARTWSKVPWVAFAHYLGRDDLVALSPETGKKVPLNMLLSEKGDTTNDGAKSDNPESDVFKRALVWEIWDKAKRKVHFIAPSYTVDVLASVDDPLNLKDFFPTPSPMMTGKVSGRLVPLSPYKIYKPILEEIDTITKRIKKMIEQLRPRALGPAGVDVDEWAGADDGEIVEVTDVMKFLESGGMDKLLAWFPMEPTVKAIESLYVRREQAKQELFEVSGLADIMRGQSNPNETKGAQDMKARWGSLRLQKAQAEVQRFCRDLFRLKAELIAEKFTPENIAAMTGLQLSSPAIAMIKDEKMRNYRIDVETDSTIRGDLTRNQEAMAQFVQGSAQYFTAIAPIVQAGGMSKTAAVTIYSAFARNFKLGKEVDAVLDSLADEATKAEQAAQAQGPQPDPEMEKIKAAIEAEKQKAAIATQKGQTELALMQQKGQLEMDLATKKFEMESVFKQREAEQKFQANGMMSDQALQLKREQGQAALIAKLSGKSTKGLDPEKDDAERQMIMDGFSQLGQLIAQAMQNQTASQNQIATLIAQGNQNLLQAVTAPKVVTTPDGRTYTSQTATVN